MTRRQRADRLLVERGLFESRARAKAAILAGGVTADDRPVRRPSDEISVAAVLRAEPEHPWVSRGGVKLAAALDRHALDVNDRICLDVGASTGGFTEVLLASGARRVYAVDVGRNQLHQRLRGRPDIVSLEETDIRTVDAGLLCEPPSVVVIDVSFISLKLVLPAVSRLAGAHAHMLALIKPQFEVGRRSSKGIVRDPAIHAAVCGDVASCAISLGWQTDATFPSPILGGDGNREFFLAAHR